MTRDEQEIDQIDCELFRLADRADRLAEKTKNPKHHELARLIRAARAKSFYLLPDKRRKELAT